MTASQLLAVLRGEGAWLRLENGEPKIKAPPGVLNPERLSQLRAMRSEIIALLCTHSCTRCHRGAFPTAGVICFRCRNKRQDPEAA